MATAFDFALLDMGRPSRYVYADPIDAIAFQRMVREFMSMVRHDPDALNGKLAEVERFVSLVLEDEAWPLAALVVPEFQLNQSHDTSGPGLLNIILTEVESKRPARLHIDPTLFKEREMLRRRVSDGIEYLWLLSGGTEDLSEEERAAMDRDTRRAMRVVLPDA